MTKKLITVSPSRLGDAIFCSSLFRFLKTAMPDLEIDVITLTPLAHEVLKDNPYIHHLFYQPSLEEMKQLSHAYDYVVRMHESPKSKEYLSLFNKIDFAYSIDCAKNRHQTDKLINFFGEAFKINTVDFDPHYDLFPAQCDDEKIIKWLTDAKIDFDKNVLIGLHIGCHGLSKKRKRPWGRFSHKKAWPIKRFIALATRLQKENEHIRFVLTGSNAEAPLGELFCKQIPGTINLIEKTSVLELAALMKYLKLYVSNDTGALHVACASNIPVIALFGPSDAIANGPFPQYDNRIVIQKDPITKITVDDVCKGIKRVGL